MTRFGLRYLTATLVLVVLAFAPESVRAHPHVFVEARSEIVFDDAGHISAVRHIWRFDPAFTAYATVNLDTDGDGAFSDEELEPLARVNVESLAEFDFFTWLTADGADARFMPPSEYWLELHGNQLTLFFTLPLATPVNPGGRATLEVFDPEYFVAFEFVEDNPVVLVGAPEGCSATYRPPGELDAETMDVLAQIPADERELPSELREATSELANLVTIECPLVATAAAAPQPVSAPPSSGTPFGVAVPDTPGGAAWFGGPLGSAFVWIADRQAEFYRALTGAFGRIGEDGRAAWLLIGLSFLYGIFHAAGPGHGKAVISSYLFATGETMRRGIAISFAAAFLQAVTAVVVVTLAALVFRAAAQSMAQTTEWVTVASYALIVALGAWLLWAKTFGGYDHAHAHANAGDHASGTGHDHGDEGHHHHFVAPGTHGAAALSAIAAVGLRPCSGALIVLVFALSQGLFATGIAATFVMAVGTGLTVAILAILAVSARGLAVRLAGPESPTALRIVRGVEIAAAAFVLAVGLMLLGGALATG